MTATVEDAEAEILDLLAGPDPDPAPILDVIRRIEASRDVADPDVAAALGYFWYLVPGDDARRVTEGERWLEDALRRQPNHALARLYLGHFAFDRGDLGRAVEHLRAVPAGTYEERGQVWRALKLRELILAAGLRVGEPDVDGIVRFIADYDATPEDERMPPRELVEAATFLADGERSPDGVAQILEWAAAQ